MQSECREGEGDEEEEDLAGPGGTWINRSITARDEVECAMDRQSEPRSPRRSLPFHMCFAYGSCLDCEPRQSSMPVPILVIQPEMQPRAKRFGTPRTLPALRTCMWNTYTHIISYAYVLLKVRKGMERRREREEVRMRVVTKCSQTGCKRTYMQTWGRAPELRRTLAEPWWVVPTNPSPGFTSRPLKRDGKSFTPRGTYTQGFLLAARESSEHFRYDLVYQYSGETNKSRGPERELDSLHKTRPFGMITRARDKLCN